MMRSTYSLTEPTLTPLAVPLLLKAGVGAIRKAVVRGQAPAEASLRRGQILRRPLLVGSWQADGPLHVVGPRAV